MRRPGFTQTEIVERTDLHRGSVGVVLSRLEDRGAVRHKGRYCAIAEDDRLAFYAAQFRASSASTTTRRGRVATTERRRRPSKPRRESAPAGTRSNATAVHSRSVLPSVSFLDRFTAGEISLSKAADLAELSVWEFARLLEDADEGWVSSDGLEADLEEL